MARYQAHRFTPTSALHEFGVRFQGRKEFLWSPDWLSCIRNSVPSVTRNDSLSTERHAEALVLDFVWCLRVESFVEGAFSFSIFL